MKIILILTFLQHREKLQLEIAARERAERKQQEYEERLRSMEEDLEKRQSDLKEAQDMIRRLEEQLRQLQAAKEELETRQNELHVIIIICFFNIVILIKISYLKSGLLVLAI